MVAGNRSHAVVTLSLLAFVLNACDGTHGHDPTEPDGSPASAGSGTSGESGASAGSSPQSIGGTGGQSSPAGGGDDAGAAAAPTAALPEVAEDDRTAVTDDRILNREATVPPQCYTKTEGRYNPCHTCHQIYDRGAEDRLNRLDDGTLQGAYNFSDVGVENHWTNLFVDRRDWLDAIDDATILAYIAQDNYGPLQERLSSSGWTGFIPDLEHYQLGAEAFDDDGLALDGSYWVAFNYKPFPGTFWPTNGSTDDVVLRLPAAFREIDGQYRKDAYFVNLTLVELNIKQLESAPIRPINESALGVDIDANGKLTTATSVVRSSHFIGDASAVALAFMQFPEGTEFMHSVRYVGVNGERIVVPKRMKELRYMRKVAVLDRYVIDGQYAKERKEKLSGALPSFVYRGDQGLDNALGWYVKGFVEDYDGELRPQSREEDMFCMGCHTNIGTTIDSTFAFARKVTGQAGWGYIDLEGMRDAPTVSEPGGEILNYLKRAGGGSEFRENPEMMNRWFNDDGTVNEDAVASADVYTLITPSVRRALDLDKAYTHIVRHQSFVFGRDSTWIPLDNVYPKVDQSVAPLEAQYQYFGWDLRLDWGE